MTFSPSEEINQWFTANSEGDRYDWFWRFIEETEPYDAKQSDEDYPDELFEHGFILGRDAAERPVFTYSTEDSAIQLYFMGYEKNIITALQFKLDNWLRKYPQGTEEEKRQTELKRQIERAELELRNKQLSLENLQQLLKNSESRSEEQQS
jgi:predicted RNase H-like nuclease (RuvC/YqgF family)